MLIQSSRDELILLPALPEQWSEGNSKGAGTRCGVTVDLVWKEGQPVSAKLNAHQGTSLSIRFRDLSWDVKLEDGETLEWKFSK